MAEGPGLKAIGEDDISHLLTVDSPFMKPEFVLGRGLHDDAPASSTSCKSSTRKANLFELQQQRFIQQLATQDRFAARNRQSAPTGAAPLHPNNCSRPASPFPKPPKVIKHEEDDSLYVKVEDLPQDVRDQVRGALAAGAEDSTTHIDGNCTHPPRKLPFSEPTRLSAQPTMEEIQMCFAQVDLAILMETKPTRKNASPTFRSASATSAASAGSGQRFAAMAARRREKLARSQEDNTPLPTPPQAQAHYAESEQYESDNSSSCFAPILKPKKPFTLHASLANSQPPSRMQQLLIDLANLRRNSAAVINSNETDNDVNAVKSKPDPESVDSWPPFAVLSDHSRRSSEQIQQNFSFLRDDFVRKLEEIQALAAAKPRNIEDADVSVSSGSKRAYQMPVWTHGGSNGGKGGRRMRYQSSSYSEEEYELLDPLVTASRGAGRHGHLPRPAAGDADQTSTDTESLAA